MSDTPFDTSDSYTVRRIPVMRRFSIDAGHLGRRRNMMHGLAEVDVTEARRRIHLHRERTGETLSFTGYVVACLARAVEAHREVHAYRDWRGRLVIYDDVNVNVMIEIDTPHGKAAMPRVIRAAQRLSVRQIHDQIRAAQATPAATEEQRFMRWFLLLPGPVRRAAETLLMRVPQLMRSRVSSILLTSVGMFGHGASWALTLPNFPLNVALGGIVERPRLVGDRLENCEMLCITVSIDHDIVDGAPAARFGQRLRELLESAELLDLDSASPRPDQST